MFLIVFLSNVNAQSPLDSLDIYDPFTHKTEILRIIKSRLSILSGENKTLINKYAIQIEKAKKSNSKEEHANALMKTGYIFFKSALYNLALDYYLRALNIYEETSDLTKTAYAEIEIGRTYYFADLVPHSTEYINRAYKKLVKTNEEELIAYANYAMGTVTDDGERKTNYFKKALEIQKRVLTKSPNNNVAKERYARFLNANGHFEQTLKIAEDINDKWLIVLYLNNIGQVKYLDGKYNEAIDLYKRSLKISKAAKLMGLLKNTYVNLAVIYRLMGNWQRSAEYREIAACIIESLYEEEYTIQLTEMRVKYDTRKKVLENEFLRKEKDIMQAKISDEVKLNYFLIITIIGITLTTVLSIVSRKKIKSAAKLLAKQKNEINEKNKILESLNLALRKSEDSLNNALATAQLANWEWDAVKDEITYSKGFPKIYGVEEEELKVNPRKVILEKIHNDDKEAFSNYFYNDLGSMQIQESEYRIIDQDKVKWIRTKRIPQKDENTNVVKVFGTIQDISESKKIEETKIQLASQQSFTKQLLKTQEEERKRIARELHDSFGQHILLIKNRAQLALQSEMQNSFTVEQLNKINDSTAELLNMVREISFDLRPAHLERLGLTDTILALLNKIAETAQINISHNVDNVDNLLSGEAEINIYRIIQEATSNIVKHSQSRNAEINISKKEHLILIEIIDDGVGFAFKEKSTNGFGLNNMRNRMNILNGELIVNSQNLKGTKLIIKIPF